MALLACAVLTSAACKDKPATREQPVTQRAEQRAPAAPQLETPEVKGPGVVPATGIGPKITFGTSELKLGNDTVVTLGPEGTLDPAQLQRLTRMLETKATSDAPVGIALDASIPYRRLGVLLDALRRGGFRNLALLTGSGAQMIPIELPDAAEVNGAGLRPVVTIQRSRLTLWSASGEEGTKMRPKLTLDVGSDPSFAPVTRALADIVERRWPDGKRADSDRTIIVQLDGAQPARVLLELLAAVRADGSRELFPNIFLAGG
jgi:hypothetical protein